MQVFFKRYDIIFIVLLFILTVLGQHYEVMPGLEEPAIAFRQAMRVAHGDPKITSFSKDKILLVAIDEDFYSKYEGYPLKRSDLGRLIRNIDSMGARVIVCDLFLGYPGAYGDDDVLAAELAHVPNVVIASQLLLNPNEPVRISFPYRMFKNAAATGYAFPTPGTVSEKSPIGKLPMYSSLVDSYNEFPLSVTAISKYMGVIPELSGGVLFLNGGGGIEPLPFNELIVDFSALPKNVDSIETLAGISAHEYLHMEQKNTGERKRLEDLAKGKIVIIGDTSRFSGYMYETPMGKMHGSEILAEAINTILRGAPLRPASTPVEVLCCFFFLAAIFLCVRLIRDTRKRFICAVALFMVYGLANTSLYVYHGLVISLGYTFSAGFLGFCTTSLKAHAQSDKVKRQVYGRLRDKGQKLAATQEKYRGIYENAVEGIFTISEDKSLISANPAFAKALGYKSDIEIINSMADSMSRCFKRPYMFEALLDDVRRNERVIDREMEFVRKDRSTFWGSISARTVTDSEGNLLCFEGALLDITPRMEKMAAEGLGNVNLNLLSRISREIRTPMNAVINLCQLAIKNHSSSAPAQHLKAIETSCRDLLFFLDGIDDLSKSEGSGLVPEKEDFRLFDVLDQLIEAHGNLAARKGIELILDVDMAVPHALRGDRSRLRRILGNLMDNAVKFTDSGEIVIEIRLLETDDIGFQLRFGVTDTGVGMKPEEIESIFPVTPGGIGAMANNDGGPGLGLLIGKKLVDLMGGEIWVESHPGKGSGFFFTAGFYRPAEPKKEKVEIPRELDSMRVLVADDNPRSLFILESFLKNYRFEPTCVLSAEAAYEALRDAEVPYDLIILDHAMPNITGLSLARKIRDNGDLLQVPIILMVTFGDEKIFDQCPDMEAVTCIFKPVKYLHLLETLLEALGQETPRGRTPDNPALKNIDPRVLVNGARVLVAEDNEINLRAISETLKSAGIQIEMAQNGREAIHAIQKGFYDAVLMDLQMPKMDGFEATRQIRSDPGFRNLPIILMSASASDKDRQTAFEIGATAFIKKPIIPNKFYFLLARFMALGREIEDSDMGKSEINVSRCLEKIDMEKVKGIDVEKALLNLDGKTDLFLELLNRFSGKYATAPAEIRNALKKGDSRGAKGIAHNFKSVAGFIMAENLEEKAGKIETAIIENQTGEMDTLLIKMENELKRVLTSTSYLVENRKNWMSVKPDKETTSPDGVSADEMSSYLIELNGLLRENSLDATDCLDCIKRRIKGHEARECFQRLEDQIGRLDFGKARRELAAIGKSLGVPIV